MAETDTIALHYPIEVDGVAVTHLTIPTRLKTRHMRIVQDNAKDGDVAALVALLANMTGLSAAAIDDLDVVDFMELQERVMGFLDAAGLGELAPTTGAA